MIIAPIRSIAFSPDGKTLVSSGCGKIAQRDFPRNPTPEVCVEGEIRFWNVATQLLIEQPLAGHTDQILNVAFSPDGKTLASASGQHDGTIQLWDVTTRQPVGRAFSGYATDMRKVIFSPDGKTLVSASAMWANKTYNIFLWDVATHQHIGQPLTAHTYDLLDIALSPDGQMLASCGLDKPKGQRGTGDSEKAVLLWDMNLKLWEKDACRVANRNLTQAEWEQYFPDQPYRETCPGPSIVKSEE
jgi:WD40 repeat protein